jgi:FtsP/CotA-like multicopper oxidase with cupredoxin domain
MILAKHLPVDSAAPARLVSRGGGCDLHDPAPFEFSSPSRSFVLERCFALCFALHHLDFVKLTPVRLLALYTKGGDTDAREFSIVTAKYVWTLEGTVLPVLGLLLALFRFTSAASDDHEQTDVTGSANANPCGKVITTPEDAAKKYNEDLLKNYGGAPFANPPEVVSHNGVLKYYMVVDYATNTVAGCRTSLRAYNAKLVGDTLRVRPGDVLKMKLINNLPSGTSNTHPQRPPPRGHARHFSFNVTNLHTHGLHVSPRGRSDNVFLQVQPQTSQYYKIQIPANHPSGTFWYHAHLHGATAIQVSSGMAGALIVDSDTGLDAIPEVKASKDQVFVLQQFVFDENGHSEDFEHIFPGSEPNSDYQRHIMVNGQLFPTIRMRPGEVQRWRFIHAGVQDNINLSLDGHKLNEIAADGIPLGRMVSWQDPLLLAPGYRSDVLIKAQLRYGETSSEYFLRDGALPPRLSLHGFAKAKRLAGSLGLPRNADQMMESINSSPGLTKLFEKPEGIIARVIVEGEPLNMPLPGHLEDTVPALFGDIGDNELKGRQQTVSLVEESRNCKDNGDCKQLCNGLTPRSECRDQYLIDDHIFMPSAPPRRLKLGTSSKWTVKTNGLHIFHIHVNPFQTTRTEPDGKTHKVWKDTILTSFDAPTLLRSRYTDFTGRFVLHCHILGHEDVGMMQAVEINK